MEEFAFECCRCTRTMCICVPACVYLVNFCVHLVRVCAFVCTSCACVKKSCAREEQHHLGRDPALDGNSPDWVQVYTWDPNAPTFEAAHKHISVLKVC